MATAGAMPAAAESSGLAPGEESSAGTGGAGMSGAGMSSAGTGGAGTGGAGTGGAGTGGAGTGGAGTGGAGTGDDGIGNGGGAGTSAESSLMMLLFLASGHYRNRGPSQLVAMSDS